MEISELRDIIKEGDDLRKVFDLIKKENDSLKSR
jgi:hypothetical protein